MSVRMITRVFDMRVGDHVAKSVLIKLADFANDEGTSWPSVDRISHDTEIPVRTVKRKLAWLEAEGFIERRKQRSEGGQFGLTFYWINPAPGATVAHGTGGQGGSTAGHHVRGSERVPFVAGTVKGTSPPGDPPMKAGGKKVTDAELAMARGILAAWNEAAGQSMTSDVWIRKIVMRLREHPELDLEAHVALIGDTLGNPWWEGAATPAVIYGNGGVFEAALVGRGSGRKAARRFGRGLTTAEILEHGRSGNGAR